MKFTLFRSLYDNVTSNIIEVDDFDQLEEVLYHLSTLPACKPSREDRFKKSSPLISPAMYEPGSTRSNKGVTEWSEFAMIDIDEYPLSMIENTTLEDALANIYSDLRYICYSTASSRIEKPKFRLVFSLSRKVMNHEIRAFWYALNQRCQMLCDPQTKDLSRMYFVPGQYENAYNFIFGHTGVPIDVDALMRTYPFVEPVLGSFVDRLPKHIQELWVQHRQRQLFLNTEQLIKYQWTSYQDCPFVKKDLIEKYQAIAYTDGSGRYRMIYSMMVSIASSAIRLGYPITESMIVDLIREIDASSSNRYKHRALETEATRALEWAYRNTTVSPRGN